MTRYLHSLSDTSAGFPNEADYDAVYAEITATDRGHWFLAKYLQRNRAADTQRLLGAIARVEVATRGEPPPQIPAALCTDLVELAAAIVRLEAQLIAIRAPASNGTAVVQRIQDIAHALRERSTDATLCNGLDAAIREIDEALTDCKAVTQRAHGAASLLRDMAVRVSVMIALTGRPAAHDPLASLRALSEEELIALFS